MLHLYQSNRLETLIDLLSTVVQYPPQSVLEPERIIIPSQGMGRWVSLQLTDRIGISANLDFKLPASFTWQMLRDTLKNIPERSHFDPQVLLWRIMDWLSNAKNLERFDRLNNYLQTDNDSRRFALSNRIALAFDQYMVYRPDWISAWENNQLLKLGIDEIWQAEIWRSLTLEIAKPHRVALMQQLFDRIDNTALECHLPERLSIFGVSSLPPVFGDLIKKLSKKIEVYFFIINPCSEEWGQIFDNREISRRAGGDNPDTLYLETGNPLLATLGKQAREYFDSVYADFPQIHSLFQEPIKPAPTMLQILQQDILKLVNRQQSDAIAITPSDQSIQIQICHSPMREVEILHDQLLELFNSDTTLNPSDVAVLVPDIGPYAPLIEAVFGNEDAPKIPFSIADLGIVSDQPLLTTFIELLNLNHNRFEADQILELLQIPSIMRRFGLSTSDIPQINYWVENSGIRWGRNGADKRNLGLPEEQQHTWQWGLKRLMLGYALPCSLADDNIPLFADLLPFDDIEGQRLQVFNRFIAFVETLFDFIDQLSADRNLQQWSQDLILTLDRVFDPAPVEDAAIQQIRNSLCLLGDLADQTNFNQPVSLDLIKHWLKNQWEQKIASGGFLTGSVNFCTLVPMRSLPFKVIWLLGMDDGAFPRMQHPTEFDLISLYPRAGDRARRSDDRYCFLETLLSTRQKLIISYTGKDIRTDSSRAPSVLISKLIETIQDSCKLPGDDNIVDHITRYHRLQPFDPEYFRDNPKLPSFSKSWLSVSQRIGIANIPAKPLFNQKLPDPGSEWAMVSLDQLSDFFGNPARYVLRNRLGVNPGSLDTRLENKEPFMLDYFSQQKIRQWELNALANDTPTQLTEQLVSATGYLPQGTMGLQICREQREAVKQISGSILPLLDAPVLDPINIEFNSGDIRLYGWLKQVRPAGLVAFRLANVTANDRFQLWLKHLILCLLKPPGIELQSQFIGTDKHLLLAPVESGAEDLIKQLLMHYSHGLCMPLPFFVKSGIAYCETLINSDDKNTAKTAAGKTWSPAEFGNNYGFGESENEYYEMVYRHTDPIDSKFCILAEQILMPMCIATTEI